MPFHTEAGVIHLYVPILTSLLGSVIKLTREAIGNYLSEPHQNIGKLTIEFMR